MYRPPRAKQGISSAPGGSLLATGLEAHASLAECFDPLLGVENHPLSLADMVNRRWRPFVSLNHGVREQCHYRRCRWASAGAGDCTVASARTHARTHAVLPSRAWPGERACWDLSSMERLKWVLFLLSNQRNKNDDNDKKCPCFPKAIRPHHVFTD